MSHPAVYIVTGIAVVAAAIFAFYNNYRAGPSPPSSSNPQQPHTYRNSSPSSNATKTCDLCSNDIKETLTTLSCGHCFHRNCIQRWVNNKIGPNCPNCGMPVNIHILNKI